MLAGGLNINNIKKALKTAKPDIVDISSGVEKERGVKCEEKIRNFIKYVEKI
jgi:phosphoribosylanthranilate isomerase